MTIFEEKTKLSSYLVSLEVMQWLYFEFCCHLFIKLQWYLTFSEIVLGFKPRQVGSISPYIIIIVSEYVRFQQIIITCEDLGEICISHEVPQLFLFYREYYETWFTCLLQIKLYQKKNIFLLFQSAVGETALLV